MARRKRSGKRGKNKSAIGKLYGYCKLLLLLVVLAVIAVGIWYTQQDEGTQRQTQYEAIDVHAGSEGMWSEVTFVDREVAAAHIRSRFACSITL